MAMANLGVRARENKVLTYLYRHQLEFARFPELRTPPGRYGASAVLLRPEQDERVPLPAASPLGLRVGYVLSAGQVPDGAQWWLDVHHTDAEGRPQVLRLPLPEQPSGQDNVQSSSRRRPPSSLPKGSLFMGVFWVDLQPLAEPGLLRPGVRLDVGLGERLATVLLP